MPHTKTFTVADLAKRVRISPRLARRKLRAAVAAKENVPASLHEYNWEFRAKDAPKVVSILRH